MKNLQITLNTGLAILLAGLSSPTMAAEQARSLLELHNQTRAEGFQCSGADHSVANPLTWNEKLAKAAEIHVAAMAEQGKLSHNVKGSISQRLAQVDYDWFSYGENVAVGIETAEAVHQAWLESKTHCKNIMDPKVSEMGAAWRNGYWVVLFAEPLKR